MNTLDPSQPPVSAAAVPLDLPAARGAQDVVALRLAGLLEAVPDPQAPTRGLAWTLGETSLHLAGGPAVHTGSARGRARPEPTIDLGPVFAWRMAAQPEQAPSVLAWRLDANARPARCARWWPLPGSSGCSSPPGAQRTCSCTTVTGAAMRWRRHSRPPIIRTEGIDD
jgi:hypothetical protein